MNIHSYKRKFQEDVSMLSMISDITEFDKGYKEELIVNLYSNFTIDPIEVPLIYYLKACEFKSVVEFGNHDDFPGDLQEPKKEMIVVYLISIESLTPNFVSEIASNEENWIFDLVQSKLDALKISAEHYRGHVNVGYISNSKLYPPNKRNLNNRIKVFVEEGINNLARTSHNINVLQTQNAVEEIGSQSFFRVEKYFTDFSILTSSGLASLSKYIAIDISIKREQIIKVICIDADDTIWGGILGEVGFNNIVIAKDSYPGIVFRIVQEFLSYMKTRGVLLCLVTKNEPEDIREVFESNRQLVLSLDDFAIISTGWRPKSERIKQISEDLSLSLENFYFIDDSSIEIESVQVILPEVQVLQVSKSKLEFLEDVAELMRVVFLQSDLSETDRTELYRQRAGVKDLERKSLNRDEFLASLGTKLRISLNRSEFANRVSELSKRTNQFNSSLRQYLPNEVELLNSHSDYIVFTGEVVDKFGSHGNGISAITHIIDGLATVESFWVSCRVLGRDIETDFLIGLCGHLNRIGCSELRVPFSKGPRNNQVFEFMIKFASLIGTSFDTDILIIKLPLSITNKHTEVEIEHEY